MIFNTCFWAFGNLHRVSECKLLLCLFNVPVAFFSQYNSFPHLPQIACFACFAPLPFSSLTGSDSTWMRVVYLSSSSLTGSGSIGSIESCPLQISGYRPQHWLISQDITRIMQDIPYLITILMGITESWNMSQSTGHSGVGPILSQVGCCDDPTISSSTQFSWSAVVLCTIEEGNPGESLPTLRGDSEAVILSQGF